VTIRSSHSAQRTTHAEGGRACALKLCSAGADSQGLLKEEAPSSASLKALTGSACVGRCMSPRMTHNACILDHCRRRCHHPAPAAPRSLNTLSEHAPHEAGVKVCCMLMHELWMLVYPSFTLLSRCWEESASQRGCIRACIVCRSICPWRVWYGPPKVKPVDGYPVARSGSTDHRSISTKSATWSLVVNTAVASAVTASPRTRVRHR
jgi:hypothetical protein